MKVQELRIGSYVIDNLEICQVLQIEANGNVMTTCKSKFPISHINELQSVELTEDLLLKCELGQVGASFVSDLIGVGTLRFVLSKIKDRFFIEYGGKHLRVASLHELQNIYHFITKRELEVDL